MNVKLIGTKVLLEPKEKDTVSEGGIILGDSAEKPQEATVVACGPGDEEHVMTVTVGDKILHGKYSGTEIDVEDKTYLIMEEKDILIILGASNE